MKQLNKLIAFLVFVITLLAVDPIQAISKNDVKIIPHKRNTAQHRKGKIAICSLFKSEAPFLKEWIEYHRLIGVSHFYLYNNCSTDDYMSVLRPYILEGVVELFNVPFDSSLCKDGAATHNFIQVCCYQHAIDQSKGKSSWLAIIDSDEFVCPVKTKKLTDCLDTYSYASGMIVYWQIYGTSNVWELGPKELMLEKLVYKAPTNYGENWSFKTIVRPEYAVCIDPHWTNVTAGVFVAPNHSQFSHTPPYTDIPVDNIRINHYAFRTESFYRNVKMKRRMEWGWVPSPEHDQQRIDLANSVHDPVMLRLMPALRKKMFQQKD